ncbi:hypothetical protein B0H10DRAFT_2308671 [Mycena sp. CBHHK59/15]|nr:hypothetical protein B0H10DRAFT_2308671 [Mycena sp. CBHHK59/15]
MAAFALFLVLLIVGLQMLLAHSPYPAPFSRIQFFWTYFPVAILMVVEWVWVAYDLQVKVLVPWAAMSRGFTPAHKGWLLDYVGANYFLAIWNAVRYRHVVVLLAMLGLWSTAVAGVVTTSLFQIEEVVHTAPATFAQTTVLDSASTFGPSSLTDQRYLTSYLGRQTLALARPRWTTDDGIVMEAFADASSAPAGGILLAQTLGYSADLTCTAMPVSYAGNTSIPSFDPEFPTAYSIAVDIAGAGCTTTYNFTDTNTRDEYAQEIYYYGRVYNHTCAGSSGYTTVLVMITMHIPAAYVNSTFNSASAWISSTSSPGRLRGNSGDNGFQADPWNIWGTPAVSARQCDCDPWFFLVGHGQNVSQAQLLDAAVLAHASRAVFTGVWSDMAGALLLTADAAATSIAGEVSVSVTQLVARRPSVRIAQAALGVLVLVTIVVWVLQPRAALPMDPASIAAQTFLLHRSRVEVAEAVRDTATMGSDGTLAALGECEFAARNEGWFLIATRWRGEKPVISPSPGPATAWRPTILHPIVKGVLALVIIGTITALELALRRSIANQGFADLNSTGQNSWTYLAPTYLFFLGIFLNSYTFSISSLEPYFAMSASPQPARKSVRYSPAQRTSLGLVFHALRYQSLVGLSCAAIMLVVPFLKIAVSGLITTAPVPVQNQTQIALNTMFNTTTILTPAFGSDGDPEVQWELPGETLALAQISKYQLPLPAWTTPTGAVGHVDLGRLGALTVAANTTVTIPLPVMRGDLENCTALTPTVFTLILPENEVELPLPPMTTDSNGQVLCTFNGYPRPNEVDRDLVLLTLPSSPGWFGQCYHPTCGGYVIIYGNTQAANATVIDKITVVQCASYSMSMSTQNVTLAYDAPKVNILSIDPSKQDTIVMESFRVNETGYPAHYLPPTNFDPNSSRSFDPFMQILTLHDASTPLDAYLDTSTLTSAAQVLYTTYWSIWATINLVIPVNANGSQPAAALVSYSHTRIVQAVAPTSILQALLACVLVFGLMTALAVPKTTGVLKKPPYAIGATMCLLADSAFVELDGLQLVQREADLNVLLEPYTFRLGWESNVRGGNRFGVDIVPP